MEEFVEIIRAISDSTRIRILMALINGELCVCRIIALLKLAPSTISKHLSILKHAKLLKSHKEGKWIFFELDNKKNNFATLMIDIIYKNLKYDSIIISDAKALKEIKKMKQENLCRQISQKTTKKRRTTWQR